MTLLPRNAHLHSSWSTSESAFVSLSILSSCDSSSSLHLGPRHPRHSRHIYPPKILDLFETSGPLTWSRSQGRVTFLIGRVFTRDLSRSPTLWLGQQQPIRTSACLEILGDVAFCRDAPANGHRTTDSAAKRDDRPWQLRTRSVTCATENVPACNLGVLREGPAPTGTGCARGPLLTGDASQGAAVMHRSPRQDSAIPPGD
jgi:hypothetical protein